MLLYILSRLGSICLGLASILYLVTPWQYLPRLCIYFISCHAFKLAVSAQAWHAILYLVALWQNPLGLGMLFYIMERLGSICRGLACHSISYHTLAVSGEAWYAAILCLVTPWQCPPRLGMLFLSLFTPWQYLPKDQPSKTQATKAQVLKTIPGPRSP